MKFEEESLFDYLVKNLESLTEANPVILAKYVVALLKKDKPLKELQKLCADSLVEFLGNGAMPFTTKLFQALENGFVLKINNEHQNMEPFQPPITEEIYSVNTSPTKNDNILTSSEQSNDSGDHDISDDDDDDRNHKHRRRGEVEHNSMQNDNVDHFVRKPNRKRDKLYDNVQECNAISERNNSSKFSTYRSKVTPHVGLRTRFIQPARFDLSTAGRPIGRGRGRGPWNSHDALASHANLFVGSGTQNSSWGGFGFIPGMANGLMDPLNPLGLQGALRPTINPPISIGMPRQRCRDFEERGFCLRGDMCPMEHGLNRIVVEDVQSLSQFNLPVSIPSSHALGIQNTSGALPPTSSQLASSKSTPNKSIKTGTMCDSSKLKSKLKNIPSISMGNDADVYDPDQPLWNNDVPSTSALLRHSSPNIEAETSYAVSAAPSNTNSSTWGHIVPKNKSNAVKMEDHKESLKGTHAFNQNEGLTKIKIGPNASTFNVNKNGKALLPKAQRTLHVYGIPQTNNRRDALMEHFQKFGVVIDIYIPKNSEKAFVQFSKREEAEAALNSPDAIMGNRFIKLSWATRDRNVYSGPIYGQNNFIQPHASKLNIVNGGKGIASNSTHKNSLPSSVTTPDVSVPAKDSISISQNKIPAPIQKKNESLELLEELRKKQESLAKKREDFKRQLEEFTKQAVNNKKGDLNEQAVKKQKVDSGGESVKAADQVTEKKPENASNGLKINPHISQRSLKNIYQTSYAPVLSPNRYKLDNRSTSFKIFPLPADIANVTAIKDHFSCYGVITSVVLGDQDNIENKNLSNCENRSACITFANRQSAEKAYLKGKFWDDHDINFKWVAATQNLSSSSGAEETSSLPTMASQSSEAKKTNLQHNQDPDTNCLPELVIKSPKGNPQSSLVKSSYENRPFGSSTQLMIEDDMMDSSAL